MTRHPESRIASPMDWDVTTPGIRQCSVPCPVPLWHILEQIRMTWQLCKQERHFSWEEWRDVEIRAGYGPGRWKR